MILDKIRLDQKIGFQGLKEMGCSIKNNPFINNL